MRLPCYINRSNNNWYLDVYDYLFNNKLRVGEAVDQALLYRTPTGVPEGNYSLYDRVFNKANREKMTPHIFGDRNMTLKGLYKVPRGLVDWARVETTMQ